MSRWVFAAAAVLAASSAWADAVYISVTNRAFVGRGFPSVHVQILEPVAGCRLRLKRSAGKAVGLVVYEVKGDGSLEGAWTISGKDGSGTETLTPQ